MVDCLSADIKIILLIRLLLIFQQAGVDWAVC